MSEKQPVIDTRGDSGINVRIVAIFGVLFFGLGILLPDVMWGTHFVAFLPLVFQVVLFVAAVYFILVYPQSKEKPLDQTLLSFLSSRESPLLAPVVAIGMGVVYYLFPIVKDVYGDAAFIFGTEEVVVTDPNTFDTSAIWSFNYLDPKLGTATIMSWIAWLSYALEISAQKIFRFWDALCGAVFVFIWIKLITRKIESRGWRTSLIVLVILAPFTQVFFGHFEVYAGVIAMVSVYLYFLVRFFEQPSTSKWLIVLVCFLLCMKMHITSLLLGPSLLIALFWLINKKKDQNIFFSLKNVLYKIAAPLFVLAAIVYVPFGGMTGKRSFTEDQLLDVLFLPFSSNEPAPLDRYNLLSPSHFFDYFNQFFVWGAALVLLLVLFIGWHRKSINWKEPVLATTGITAVLYIGFYFFFNPLLGMATDWDLFALPAVPLILVVVLIAAQLGETKFSRSIAGGIVGLSIFSIGWFAMNTMEKPLGNKLISMGKWEFKTYWIGCSTNIMEGLFLAENDDTRPARLENIIEELEPSATPNNDIEYAELNHQIGAYHFHRKEYQIAARHFEKAFSYNEASCKNRYHLLLAHFMNGDMEEAYEHAEIVVACGFPNRKRSMEVAIHCAVENDKTEKALEWSQLFLKEWPDNVAIGQAEELLRNGQDARGVFASGNGQTNKTAPVQNEVVQELIQLECNTPAVFDSLKALILARKDTARPGDVYHSVLLQKVGNYCFNYLKDYPAALAFYQESDVYTPFNCEALYFQVLSNFMMQQYGAANELAKNLPVCEYPNPKKAYRVTIHTAVLAGDMEGAGNFCDAYLKRWTDDEFIRNVREAINQKRPLAEIQSMFAGG